MNFIFLALLTFGHVFAQNAPTDFLFGIDVRVGRFSEVYEASAMDGGKVRLVYRNSYGDNKSRILEKDDADYLQAQIKSLPKRSHSFANCPKDYSSFRLPQRVVLACGQSREELSVRAARILELLKFL